MDFKDKIVLVTGAGKGIGRATALAFSQQGAALVLADRDQSALDEVAAAIRRAGARADAVAADVGDEADVRGYVKTALDKYGRIDAFFCNAGIRGQIAPLAEYKESDFDDILRVNLRSVFLGLRYVLPVMVEQEYGAVVVSCSTASLAGLSSMPGYVATKHGALGLVRAAAVDVAAHGVRVNALCPGATKTPLLNELYTIASPQDPEIAAKRYAATVPTGRLIEPEEMAAMTLYLCSDKARSVTGGYFLVDGGRTVAAGTTTTTAGMTERHTR